MPTNENLIALAQKLHDDLFTEYHVEHPRILVRKGKNILLNLSDMPHQGQVFADCKTLLPQHKYYMWCKPEESFYLHNESAWFGWNSSYIDRANTFKGTVSTEGAWLYFTTSDKFPVLDGTTNLKALNKLFFSPGPQCRFENICVVSEEDWNENLEPYTDNSGYCFVLNCSLSAHDGYKDRLVQRDGKWYKATTRDDAIIAETPLDGTDCAILSAVANLIKNNAEYGYEVILTDESMNKISDLSDLVPEDIDYLRTADHRFLHKDREYIIHATTFPHEGCVDYGTSTDLSTSTFRPFTFFDAVALGFDTIQISMDNDAFHDGTALRDPSAYAIFTQAMDFAKALGIRIVFKFYSFAWGSATKTSQTMAVEKLIVDNYKDYPNVVGYSIANEPTNCGYDNNNATIKARYEAFVSEMQNYILDNTNQIVFVERDNGVDFTKPNIVFESHYYSPHYFTHNAKCSYPDVKCLWTSNGTGSGGNKYDPEVASPYPITKRVSDTTEFAWQSTGLFTRAQWHGRDSIFNSQLRIDNTAKLGENFDFKAWSCKFYDADQNIVAEYTTNITENTNINEFYIKGWTNSSDMTDLNPRRAEFLSVVQDGDDYFLRMSVPEENSLKYIQISRTNQAQTGFYDQWKAGWFDNVVYIEFQFLTRAYSTIAGSTTLIRIEGKAGCDYEYTQTFVPSELRRNIDRLISNNRNTRKVPLWIGECGTRQETVMKTGSLNGFGWLNDVFKEYQKYGVSYAQFIHSGATFGIYNCSTFTLFFHPDNAYTVDVGGEISLFREINQDNHTPNNGYSTRPTENDFRPLLSHGAWEELEKKAVINDNEVSATKTYSSNKIESLAYAESYKANLSTGVNVTKYGAKGDGTTDDSQAFINAMSAATSAGKTVIIIPVGTYNLNHVAMNITAFKFIGANRERCIIKDANISAYYGITVENVTFDGGTARGTDYEAGVSNVFRTYLVPLHVTPKYADAEVHYRNCRFTNADMASVAFHGSSESLPIVSNTIENCVFENLSRQGVTHSVHITQLEVANNEFKNIGDSTVTNQNTHALVVGDTSNNTVNRVANGIIRDNLFDTVMVGNDTSWTAHVLASYFIGVEADKIVITHNIFKNKIGYGADREGIYTKGTDVEISYNDMQDGGSGEAWICCKTRVDGASTARGMHIHHNNLIGDHGEGIRVYGRGVVDNNYISITHMSCAILFFPNESQSLAEHISITDNYVYSGVGSYEIDGVTVGNTTSDAVFNIIGGYVWGGVQMNRNYAEIHRISPTTTHFYSAFKLQNIIGNFELNDNYVVTPDDCVNSLFSGNTPSTYPETDTKITASFCNNFISKITTVIGSITTNNNAHLFITYVIKNNIAYERVGTDRYGWTIDGPVNTANIYYESTQPQNFFTPRRHLYTSAATYIYSSLGVAYFLANDSKLVPTGLEKYPRINDTTPAVDKVYSSSKVESLSLNKGSAVVFGDSLFDNPIAPYNFAERLRATRLYDAVYDHAKDGTGFGNTSGHSDMQLSALIDDPTVQAEVSSAKAIYISLGFNDIMTAIGAHQGVTETQLPQKIQHVFDTINELNPSVTIYYTYVADTMVIAQLVAQQPSKDVSATLPVLSSFTKGESRQILWVSQTIQAEICKAKGNILCSSADMAMYVNDSYDNLHPSEDNYAAVFHAIVYGGYHPMQIRCITIPNPSSATEVQWWVATVQELLDIGKFDFAHAVVATYGFYDNNTHVSFYLSPMSVASNYGMSVNSDVYDHNAYLTMSAFNLVTKNLDQNRVKLAIGVTTMPTPSSDYSTSWYQYLGASGSGFQTGMIYGCINDGTSWVWKPLYISYADMINALSTSTDFSDFKSKMLAI